MPWGLSASGIICYCIVFPCSGGTGTLQEFYRNSSSTLNHGWWTGLSLWVVLWVSPFSSKTHFSSRSCSLRPLWPKCPLGVPGCRTSQQDCRTAPGCQRCHSQSGSKPISSRAKVWAGMSSSRDHGSSGETYRNAPQFPPFLKGQMKYCKSTSFAMVTSENSSRPKPKLNSYKSYFTTSKKNLYWKKHLTCCRYISYSSREGFT